MSIKPFDWPGRRINDPAHDMLTAFLVVDIQRNSEWANGLIEKIRAVQSGKLVEWERIGNAFRLELSAKGALIEDVMDEDSPEQRVDLDEFSKAVEAWIADVD